jgi:hypothetical protein
MAGGRKRFGIALYVQNESMYAVRCPAHEFASCWLCKPKPRGAGMETDASPVHRSTYVAIDKAQGRQNEWLKGDNSRCRPITMPAIFGYKAELFSKSVTSH